MKTAELAFLGSSESYDQLTIWLSDAENLCMEHTKIESRIESDGRELLRRIFEEHIALRGLGNQWDSITGSDGVLRTYKQVSTRTVVTLFGKIKVKRTGYSRPNASTLFPLDAILKLPTDSYSLNVRKAVAYEAAKSSFSEVCASIEQCYGIQIPKRQAEILATKSAVDFNEFYANDETTSQSSSSGTTKSDINDFVVLTTDGKGIVVRSEDLKEHTREKAAHAKAKLTKRVSRGEKRNRKRMATVASVYGIARYPRESSDIVDMLSGVKKDRRPRPKPNNKRVWASLELSQAEVIEQMFSEANRRDPNKKKSWICLIDGDPKQLRYIKNEAKRLDIDLIVILDIIHVIEYLWKAARVFFEEADPKSQIWVQKRIKDILEGKAGYVAGGIARSATLKKIKDSKRKPIDTCVNYIKKRTSMMRYDEFLKQGMPIATGVIEGACRHLIKDRMDVTGARWSLKGAESILRLRSIKSSGDFEKYWAFHETMEFIRNHEEIYENASILDQFRPGEAII